MRLLRLLLIAGLVLAVGQSAWALTLTGYTAGDPMTFHFTSVDVGPVYNYGTFTGQSNCDANTLYQAVDRYPPEDAWGIAWVKEITNATGDVVYWSAATASTELTAMFCGTTDFSASRVALTPTLDEVKSFSHYFKLFLWEDANTGPNVYKPGQGPDARTGANTYPSVTEGTLILEAKGVNGIYDNIASAALGSPVYVDHKAEVQLSYDAFGNVVSVTSGSGHAFASIADADGNGTTVGLGFVNGQFATSNPAVMADIRLDWTLKLPSAPKKGEPTVGTNWWDLADQDPVEMRYGYVPEPVTMAGMLLGVGCLGRYIRKRR